MWRRSCSRACGSWSLGAWPFLGLIVGADELGHQRGHGVGVDRFAPAGREHVAVLDAAPGVARLELVGGLVGLVLAEDGDGLVVNRHDAGPAALGRAVDALARDHGGRPGDGDPLCLQVDIRPAEVEQLAPAGSGVGGDVEEGRQPVLSRGGQEGPELGDGPDGARLVGRAPGAAWPAPPGCCR